MDQEKAYIEVTEFLCTELKRIKSEKDLYKGKRPNRGADTSVFRIVPV